MKILDPKKKLIHVKTKTYLYVLKTCTITFTNTIIYFTTCISQEQRRSCLFTMGYR